MTCLRAVFRSGDDGMAIVFDRATISAQSIFVCGLPMGVYTLTDHTIVIHPQYGQLALELLYFINQTLYNVPLSELKNTTITAGPNSRPC